MAEARFHFTQSPIREHTRGLILKVEWETRPQIALQIFIAVRACKNRVTFASRSFLSVIHMNKIDLQIYPYCIL